MTNKLTTLTAKEDLDKKFTDREKPQKEKQVHIYYLYARKIRT